MVYMELKPRSSGNIHTLKRQVFVPSLALVGTEMAKARTKSFPKLRLSLSLWVPKGTHQFWSIRQPAGFENYTKITWWVSGTEAEFLSHSGSGGPTYDLDVKPNPFN
jgi:hypothetical protein